MLRNFHLSHQLYTRQEGEQAGFGECFLRVMVQKLYHTTRGTELPLEILPFNSYEGLGNGSSYVNVWECHPGNKPCHITWDTTIPTDMLPTTPAAAWSGLVVGVGLPLYRLPISYVFLSGGLFSSVLVVFSSIFFYFSSSTFPDFDLLIFSSVFLRLFQILNFLYFLLFFFVFFSRFWSHTLFCFVFLLLVLFQTLIYFQSRCFCFQFPY